MWQTMPSSQEPPSKEALSLPPLHISAIPQSTLQRIDSFSDSVGSRSSRSTNNSASDKPPATSLRSSAAEASSKLPTIAGSPSVSSGQASAAGTAARTETPTKIPRRTGVAASPRMLDHDLQEFGVIPVEPEKQAIKKIERSRTSPLVSSSSAPNIASMTRTLQESEDRFADADADSSSLAPPPVPPRRSMYNRAPSVSSATGIPRSRSTSATLTASLSEHLASDQSTKHDASGSVNSSQARSKFVPQRPVEVRKDSASQETDSFKMPAAKDSRIATKPAVKSSLTSLSSARKSTVLAHTETTPTHRRQSSGGDPPSTAKSSRTLSGKLGIPTRIARSSTSPSLSLTAEQHSERSPSASSSRNATPISEEEYNADKEMSHYVQRQRTKKMAVGASEKELKELFEFPEAQEPSAAMAPKGKSCTVYAFDLIHVYLDVVAAQARYLSEYEREEICDYKQVHWFGKGAAKFNATRSRPDCNFGFDDERGDYIIVKHDHILYRYEVTGTLGKGSFGQVVECRDHATGGMVAIKIIRNKKRFHQQALIEIKVLENLRKWVNCLDAPLSWRLTFFA